MVSGYRRLPCTHTHTHTYTHIQERCVTFLYLLQSRNMKQVHQGLSHPHRRGRTDDGEAVGPETAASSKPRLGRSASQSGLVVADRRSDVTHKQIIIIHKSCYLTRWMSVLSTGLFQHVPATSNLAFASIFVTYTHRQNTVLMFSTGFTPEQTYCVFGGQSVQEERSIGATQGTVHTE